MKKTLFFIVFILAMISVGHAQQMNTSRQVRNLTAFARLFGYVKYFHPSDEAQDISWNRFANYGSQQVINAKDDNQLRKILMDLFTPIAPSLQLYSKVKEKKLDFSGITPPNTQGLKLTCWQYEGLNLPPSSVYSSYRTNRPFKIYADPSQSMSLSCLKLVVPKLKSEFSKARVSFSIMSSPSDSTNLMYDLIYDKQSLSDSLSSSNWVRKSYVFEDVNPKKPHISLFLYMFQEVSLDSLRCEVFADNNWQTVYYNDFDSDTPGNMPSMMNVNCSDLYGFITANNETKVVDNEGNKVLNILYSPEQKYTYGYMNKIYEDEAKLGDFVDEPLVKGLSCIFPLSLYCYNDHTYPPADSTRLKGLKSILEPIDLQDRDDQFNLLGGLFIYWNQLNFFYPYWQYTKVDWEKELPQTIGKALACPDFRSFKFLLWELISKTRDNHAFLLDRDDDEMLPGFYAEPIGKQWIVTRIADETLNVPLGSVLTHINGKPAPKFMQSKRKFFTYSSKHKTDKDLFYRVMKSFPDSIATFTFKTPAKQTISKLITFKEYEGNPWFDCGKKIIRYTDDIYYLNTSVVTDEELAAMLPELAAAKGIIFDMRFYPSIDLRLLTYLLTAPDSVATYHKIRRIEPYVDLPEDEDNPPKRLESDASGTTPWSKSSLPVQRQQCQFARIHARSGQIQQTRNHHRSGQCRNHR